MLRKSLAISAVCLVLASACNPALLATGTPTPAATPAHSPTAPARAATATRAPEPTPAPATPTLEPATPTVAATPPPVGDSITRLAPGRAVGITALNMMDLTTGWALGGEGTAGNHVLRTADGGAGWRDVTPPQPAPAQPDLIPTVVGFFADGQTAWVTYGNNFAPPSTSVVWRTQDGGQTWTPSQLLEVAGMGDYFQPSHMQFVDGRAGWLLVHLGAGMNHDYVALFTTADGGVTWQIAADPNLNNLQMSCQKSGMAFADAQRGWVTGDCHGVAPGVFFQATADGGRTWTTPELPPPANAPDLFQQPEIGCGTYQPAWFSPQAGSLVVNCVFFTADPIRTESYLYTTVDAGRTWEVRPLPAEVPTFLSRQVGWALDPADPNDPAAPHDLYQTRDGGATWDRIKTVNWSGQLDFVSEQAGWAVARAGEAVALVSTTDAGRTWRQVLPRIVP